MRGGVTLSQTGYIPFKREVLDRALNRGSATAEVVPLCQRR